MLMFATGRSLLALALLPSLACGFLVEPKADITKPQQYALHGLKFDFPGNWKATTDVSQESGIEMVSVSLESSGNALQVVQQFRPAIPLDLRDISATFATEMHAETKQMLGGTLDYSNGSSDDVQHVVLGESRPAKRNRFTLSLLGEKVPHTAEIVAIELPDRSLVIYDQAADEDLAAAQPGFALVESTLAID
jgi:hypothetical protein